jgi:hypothetical protein
MKGALAVFVANVRRFRHTPPFEAAVQYARFPVVSRPSSRNVGF